MKKTAGPNMEKWKDYRYESLNEDSHVEKHKHNGDYISSKDLYDKIQELGLSNKDFQIEICDEDSGEKIGSISEIIIKDGKLIINIITPEYI